MLMLGENLIYKSLANKKEERKEKRKKDSDE
jgi:hypothetical protein